MPSVCASRSEGKAAPARRRALVGRPGGSSARAQPSGAAIRDGRDSRGRRSVSASSKRPVRDVHSGPPGTGTPEPGLAHPLLTGHPQPSTRPTAAWELCGSFPPRRGSWGRVPSRVQGQVSASACAVQTRARVGRRRHAAALGAQSRKRWPRVPRARPRPPRSSGSSVSAPFPSGRRRWTARRAARPLRTRPREQTRPPRRAGLARTRLRPAFPRSARAEGRPGPAANARGARRNPARAAAGARSPGRTRPAPPAPAERGWCRGRRAPPTVHAAWQPGRLRAHRAMTPSLPPREP